MRATDRETPKGLEDVMTAAQHPPDLEAYALYHRAQQLRATGKSRHTREIIDLCRRAIGIDASFARAWALLAVCQTLLGFDADPGEDGWDAAEKALALDPDLAEAHAVKGRLLIGRGRAVDANAEIVRALQLDPDSYDVNAAGGEVFHRRQEVRRCHQAPDPGGDPDGVGHLGAGDGPAVP